MASFHGAMDDQSFSEIQSARNRARWRKPGARSSPQPRRTKVQNKISATDVAAIAEAFDRGVKLIQEQLAAVGLGPTQLPTLGRIHRSRKSEVGVAVPAIVPEVNAPLFVRAKARMGQERGNDLPTGYWGANNASISLRWKRRSKGPRMKCIGLSALRTC
jgi:hypothetical protein